jgi:hypothetical protein
MNVSPHMVKTPKPFTWDKLIFSVGGIYNITSFKWIIGSRNWMLLLYTQNQSYEI